MTFQLNTNEASTHLRHLGTATTGVGTAHMSADHVSVEETREAYGLLGAFTVPTFIDDENSTRQLLTAVESGLATMSAKFDTSTRVSVDTDTSNAAVINNSSGILQHNNSLVENHDPASVSISAPESMGGSVPVLTEGQGVTKGIPIVDDIASLANDFNEGHLGGTTIAIGLTAVSTSIDPSGTLVSAAAGWVMEHIWPLPKILDLVAGDPAAVEGFAKTWENIGGALDTEHQNLSAYRSMDLPSFAGEIAVAYQSALDEPVEHVRAARHASLATAKGVYLAAQFIDVYRGLIRDLIAECIATVVTMSPAMGTPLAPGAAGTIGVKVLNTARKCHDHISESVTMLQKLQHLIGHMGTAKQQLIERILVDAIDTTAAVAPTIAPAAGKALDYDQHIDSIR